MATTESISRVLKSESFTAGEKSYIELQFGMAGGFQEKLWRAIAHADENNLRLLHRGFPSEVDAYISWTRGDLADRIRKEGCAIL